MERLAARPISDVHLYTEEQLDTDSTTKQKCENDVSLILHLDQTVLRTILNYLKFPFHPCVHAAKLTIL